MKLKEPLQGVKMISGHIISHFAMYIISLRINVSGYYNLDPAEPDFENKQNEIKVFRYLQYGHLVTGII